MIRAAIAAMALTVLSCCRHSGKSALPPPDGPDTPNKFDAEHGWKF